MIDQADSSSTPQPDPAPTSAPANAGQAKNIRVAAALFAVVAIVGASVAMVVNTPSEPVTPADQGIDQEVTTLGSIEVTGRLVEIRGKFLPNDGLYNYAFVMKYEIVSVHRGNIEAREIVVGHYNPLKPRPKVADEFYPDIGGTLKKFRAGDLHRMALEMPIDDYYIGGIVDRYFEDNHGPILWAVWTNLVSES